MTLKDTVTFLREHATLEDLKTIRKVFTLRLRQMQSRAAQQFRPDEPVLFIADGVEQPAHVVRVGRRLVVICLGNQRHVRCDGSFLRKLPAAGATIHRAPNGPLTTSPGIPPRQDGLLPE